MADLIRFFPGLREPLTCAGLLLALGLYTAALVLPAFAGSIIEWPLPGGLQDVSGWQAVLSAPVKMGEFLVERWWRNAPTAPSDKEFALYCGLLVRAWLSNVLFWLGLFFLAAGRGHPAWVTGAFGLYEGAFYTIWAPAAGNVLLAGYYVWLASMAVLPVSGAYRALWPRGRACSTADGLPVLTTIR